MIYVILGKWFNLVPTSGFLISTDGDKPGLLYYFLGLQQGVNKHVTIFKMVKQFCFYSLGKTGLETVTLC